MRLLAGALAAVQFGSAGADCPVSTRVGISDRGYASYRTTDRYGGIVIDMFKEVTHRTGCKFEFVWLPSVRMMDWMDSKRIDIGATLVHHPERDSRARFLPYAYTQFYLVQSKTMPERFTSLAEFTEHSRARLNVVRGLVLGPRIEAQLAVLMRAKRIEYVNNFETLFRKMESGRAEATITSPVIYLHHLRLMGLEEKVVFTPIVESPPQFIGVYASTRTLDREAIDSIAGALNEMLVDRTMQTLYARYLDPELVSQLFKPGTAALSAALQGSAQPEPREEGHPRR